MADMPETVNGKLVKPLHEFVRGGAKVVRVLSVHDIGNEQDGIDLLAVLALHVDTLTYVAGWVEIDQKTPQKPQKGEMWEVSDDHDGNSFSLARKV